MPATKIQFARPKLGPPIEVGNSTTIDQLKELVRSAIIKDPKSEMTFYYYEGNEQTPLEAGNLAGHL
jgi:hypothetical protein